ncbi:MAG TPA: DMT family transporter [Hyphomicrobiaceae bacterium]|nr:DMT family transporter [Hyphomicrobiaceae bacterium]
MPSLPRSPTAAFLLLPLAAVCWAGNHVVARAAGGHVPPASMNALRWSIVALAVLPFAWRWLRADWPKIKAQPWLMLLFGVLGGALFGTLQYVALQYTTALNMGVVGSVAPAFIVAASWLLFRERLSPVQLTGVLVSLSGVLAIVTRLDATRLGSLSFNGGDLIIIANMACWAIYCACLRARPAISGATFMLVMAVIAALGNLPFAAAEYAHGFHLQPTLLTVGTTLYAAFITTILAYVAWNTGVDIIGASRASAFLHTIPLFAAVLATTLLGERIEPFHILGFALILAGVTLVARQPALSRRAE